jgi:ubiquinone/menaquinone biosynthesis C-methylase UbiE
MPTEPSSADHWQVRGNAAELYERHLVRAITSLWAGDLVRRVNLQPGERVLDVACGTGVVARTAAGCVGQTGRVSGLDINRDMLAVARASWDGVPAIDFIEGSALALPFAGASHDVVMCQLGLQFFPDRARALGEMHRVLTPGGRLGLSVYGPIEHNPGNFALAQALDHHLGTGASQTKRAEHVLGYATLVHQLVTDAGFRDITLTTETKLIRFSSTEEYVRLQLTATPLASLLGEQLARPGITDKLTATVSDALQRYEVDGGLEFPQEAHVLLARTAP